MTTKGSVIGSEVRMTEQVIEVNGGRLYLDHWLKVQRAREILHYCTPVSAHPAWESRKQLLTSSGGKAA